MKKRFLWSLVGVLFLLLAPAPALTLDVGTVAPDFKLKSLDGKEVRLSDFKGQVILLKLATTWCPTCRQQSGEIREAGKYLKEKNVAVVEVFLQDSKTMVEEFLQEQEYDMPFAALLDDGSVIRAYNVYLIPRVLFIDKDFKIRRDGNLITAKDLTEKVRNILGEN